MTTTEAPTTASALERTGSILRHTMKKERPAPVARTALKRNVAGHDLGTVDLEPTVFGHTPNRAVLHQVVTAQLAGIRAGTQSTKTRSEVRGGGAKPFNQKGTGRARQGSSRSPSMSGGGVALGPKPRSYEQRTPKKMIRLALLSALSDRAESGHVIVLDDWDIEEPDTRAAAVILKKLRITPGGTVLAVLANDEVDVALSLRNIPEASITTHAELSAHDVVRADWLLFTERTLPTSPSDFSGTHLIEAAPPKPSKPKADTELAEKPEKAAPAKKAARATKAAAAEATKATDVEEQVEEIDEAPAKVDPPVESAAETEAEEATEAPAKKAPARKARAAKKAKEDDADA
jgi:large subunit ribosomal protein L4